MKHVERHILIYIITKYFFSNKTINNKFILLFKALNYK